MLKIRVIPILTFNGFGLVKTKQFSNPRVVGNPIQAARVYNIRGVDELIFLDIFATKHNRKLNLKLVGDVIKECFMPVGIGGGIKTIKDINDLLKIGADKVIIKESAIYNPEFIFQASTYFGAQCISISVDVIKKNGNYFIHNNKITDIDAAEFIKSMEDKGAGEIILNSVDCDGMMDGFDINLYNYVFSKTNLPIVLVGGSGQLQHYIDLFKNSNCEAVGASSIFHFTQYTPLDLKLVIKELGKPVRLL